MADEGEIDYKAEYEKVCAERDAYASKLDEYVTANNKLSADLKVQQAINRKTVGASEVPPQTDTAPKSVLTSYHDLYKKEA